MIAMMITISLNKVRISSKSLAYKYSVPILSKQEMGTAISIATFVLLSSRTHCIHHLKEPSFWNGWVMFTSEDYIIVISIVFAGGGTCPLYSFDQFHCHGESD